MQSSMEVIFRQILVSSAYKAILVPSETFSYISFIKRVNRRGPRTEPCGTHEFTGKILECLLLITTRCVLFSRYPFTNFKIRLSTLNLYLIFSKILS